MAEKGVPRLNAEAAAYSLPAPVNDEVAAILKGLKLDRKFFTEKLDGTVVASLAPRDPDAGSKPMSRQISRSSHRDFDIYLGEAMMPVLAQALDALCRQIVRMEKQGKSLDAKVRARFNPITWLAQQLLRRHPRAATTPRRMTIYRNFRDWSDFEHGRRDVLRSKERVREVFKMFSRRGDGAVERNAMPNVINDIDDVLHVRGALKGSNAIADEFNLEKGVAFTKKASIGGECLTFDQFWFLFANAIMKNDIITHSAIKEGEKLKEQEEAENRLLKEAAKQEEQRRQKVLQEHQRLLGVYEVLYPKLANDEGLKQILEGGKVLTGDFLKPTDPSFDKEVTPFGPHVGLLEEMLNLLGFETTPLTKESLGDASPVGDGRKLFRPKVKHQTVKPGEDPSKKDAKEEQMKSQKSGRRGSVRPMKEPPKEAAPEPSAEASQEKAPDPATPQAGKSDPWWIPELKAAWMVLQEMFMVKPDGLVEKKVLSQLIVATDEFVDLKRKVECEFEARAESSEGANDMLDLLLNRASDGRKPSMEELGRRHHMTQGRLNFFHDLFESFLPPQEDGTPGACLYPQCPASIDKKTMFRLVAEVQHAMGEAEFEARFRRIDKDNSGLIEFDEFVQWIHDDEVQLVDATQKPTFDELAAQFHVSVDLIMYIYACFQEELDDGMEDKYPTNCANLAQENAWGLFNILVPVTDKTKFNKDFESVDVQKKGSVHFDEFLELVDFEALPKELRGKYGC
eukprot:TRINITY_DN53104_c0_g1_i1.p1 TRINITY_DN53104_c0_g1~~TRINITY_DN53104_c0_g1_i1.p1  ORF type:complete len:739 (-),score=206.98 TRINITY_DN53104_c0_g1_i1:152-2368(-)